MESAADVASLDEFSLADSVACEHAIILTDFFTQGFLCPIHWKTSIHTLFQKEFWEVGLIQDDRFDYKKIAYSINYRLSRLIILQT